MTKISATIVADSIAPYGDRITTMLVTFPRFILAELNTHRMLSKNSASSRAIPFNKMVESVQNNPFIPIAWQKEHSGMQGTEYLTEQSDIDYAIYNWKEAGLQAIKQAKALNTRVTKQLCNRLLEPFMWHTVLITATEWENFFNLRCPQYKVEESDKLYRSKKDCIKDVPYYGSHDTLGWLKLNKGQAEIHMMTLAEAMYDAMNESTPKELKAGKWHIPFEEKFNIKEITKYNPKYKSTKWIDNIKIAVSTAMCARTSYTIVGDEKEFTVEQQIALHDRMANQVPFHASPFEHCAKVMSNKEYDTFIKGQLSINSIGTDIILYEADRDSKDHLGWCNNFKGFISYRYLLEK